MTPIYVVIGVRGEILVETPDPQIAAVHWAGKGASALRVIENDGDRRVLTRPTKQEVEPVMSEVRRIRDMRQSVPVLQYISFMERFGRGWAIIDHADIPQIEVDVTAKSLTLIPRDKDLSSYSQNGLKALGWVPNEDGSWTIPYLSI